MKYIALVLMLSALPAVSHALCTTTEMQPGQSHCMDAVDNTWHAVGSTWRNSECMDCSCEGCCNAYSIPRSFPDDCESVFDQKACKYSVHKKNDPTIPCPIFSAVGK